MIEWIACRRFDIPPPVYYNPGQSKTNETQGRIFLHKAVKPNDTTILIGFPLLCNHFNQSI